MTLLSSLAEKETWEAYYRYKSSLCLPEKDLKGLRDLIDREAYLPVVREILSMAPAPLPERTVISKQSTGKKRIVYTYPPLFNTVMKVLTYLCLRKYDHLFDPGLYSFRPGRSAKDAMFYLSHIRGIREKYAYKADVSNYFNSIPIPSLLPLLEEVLSDDPELYRYLSSLLTEPRVLWEGKELCEEKGIMAGTPLSAFYANLYLRQLDQLFHEKRIPYARYSDDIIVFEDSQEALQKDVSLIRSFLKDHGLSLNPAKENISAPEDGWVFLGFFYKQGTIDIAPANITKLKAKMRRKTRALTRWSRRNGIPGEKAAKAFIRIFNRKLLYSAKDNDLTWSYWFFPVINTTDSLHIIDRYAQDCIRSLVWGSHTKGRFRLSYQEMKNMGYLNLVHEYYKIRQ